MRTVKRGALLIEYCLLIAAICVIGVFFIGNTLPDSINSIMSTAASLLNPNENKADKEVTKGPNLITAEVNMTESQWDAGGFWQLTPNNSWDFEHGRLHSDIFAIKPNTTYELTIDLSKITVIGKEELQVQMLLDDPYTTSGSRKASYNSEWMSTTGTEYNFRSSKDDKVTREYDSSNIVKYTFTTGEDITRMALNFRTTTDRSYLDQTFGSTNITQYNTGESLKSALSLNEIIKE